MKNAYLEIMDKDKHFPTLQKDLRGLSAHEVGPCGSGWVQQISILMSGSAEQQ